jgi:hypothetical protein
MWKAEIKREYGWDLIVMPREEIISTLQVPANVALCVEHLGIVVPLPESTVETLIRNALAANGEMIESWSRLLSFSTRITLRADTLRQSRRKPLALKCYFSVPINLV